MEVVLKIVEEVYEHQRRRTANDEFSASDLDPNETTDLKRLSDSNFIITGTWKWANDWKIMPNTNLCDTDGWEYAAKFPSSTIVKPQFFSQTRPFTNVRRRRWTRTRTRPILFKLPKLDISEKQQIYEETDNIENTSSTNPQQEENVAKFQQLFSLPDEKLVTYYYCTVLGTTGVLYISENYVCFQSNWKKIDLITIPFKDIILIEKEKGTLLSSIKIKSKHDEYTFSAFMNINETYGILEQLWHVSMQRILQRESTQVDTSSAVPPGFTEDNTNSIKDTSEDGLKSKKKDEHFRKLFKLPLEESLEEEFTCSLFIKSVKVAPYGKLYVSKDFMCFHSSINETKLVLPFKEVLGITKVLGLMKSGLIVVTNVMEFNFTTFKALPKAFTMLDGLWKSAIMKNALNDSLFDILLNSGNTTTISESPNTEHEVDVFEINQGAEQNMLYETNVEEEKKKEITFRQYEESHGSGVTMVQTLTLRALVREGIPDKSRSNLWQILSGSAYRLSSKKGYYQYLLKKFESQQSHAKDEIEKDIHRSFPGHVFYKNASGREALQRVLLAYSWMNPKLGYCQSMNFITALLLLIMSEEEAFWVLATICEDLLPEYYDKNMIRSRVDQMVFEFLIEKEYPKVVSHLEELCIPLQMITIPWLLCLYISYLPMNVAIRILDSFFFEGSNILFAIGLTLFKLNADTVLNSNDPQFVADLLKKNTKYWIFRYFI